MLTLNSYRRLYPEYDQLSDYELTKSVHYTHYNDMPFDQFARQFGGPLAEDAEKKKIRDYVRNYNALNPGKTITEDDIEDRSGFAGGLKQLFEGAYDAVTDRFPEDFARAVRAGDISADGSGWTDRVIARQERDRNARVASRQEILEPNSWTSALYNGPQSVATSLATSLAGAGIGSAIGSVIPGVGTIGGGMVGAFGATLPVFRNMAKDQFVDEIRNAVQRERGSALDAAELEELKSAIEEDANEYGLYEALPESIGNALLTGILKGATGAVLNKIGLGNMAETIGRRALTRIPAKMLGAQAEEQAEEAVTFGGSYGLFGDEPGGQEGIRFRYGLRETPPTLGEYVETQAKPVAIGTLMQAGTMGAANKAANMYRNYRENRLNNYLDFMDWSAYGPEPAGGWGQNQWQGNIVQDPPNAAPFDSASILSGPAWDGTMPMAPFDSASPLSGPQLDGMAQGLGQEFSNPRQPAQQPSLNDRLQGGGTVDLMSGDASNDGKASVTSNDKSFSEWAEEQEQDSFSLEDWNRQLDQAYQDNVRQAQDLGADFAPFETALAAPAWDGTPIPQQQPVHPQPVAPIPTDQQVTTPQIAPRADTQTQAQNLGMPAPAAMPQEAQAAVSPMAGQMPAQSPAPFADASSALAAPQWDGMPPMSPPAPFDTAASTFGGPQFDWPAQPPQMPQQAQGLMPPEMAAQQQPQEEQPQQPVASPELQAEFDSLIAGARQAEEQARETEEANGPAQEQPRTEAAQPAAGANDLLSEFVAGKPKFHQARMRKTLEKEAGWPDFTGLERQAPLTAIPALIEKGFLPQVEYDGTFSIMDNGNGVGVDINKTVFDFARLAWEKKHGRKLPMPRVEDYLDTVQSDKARVRKALYGVAKVPSGMNGNFEPDPSGKMEWKVAEEGVKAGKTPRESGRRYHIDGKWLSKEGYDYANWLGENGLERKADEQPAPEAMPQDLMAPPSQPKPAMVDSAPVQTQQPEVGNGRSGTTGAAAQAGTGLERGDGGRHLQPADGNEARGERPERSQEGSGRNRAEARLKIKGREDQPVTYELVEADDVQASHLPNNGFQKNPRYGLTNERPYHNPKSHDHVKVVENARNLDPDYLLESPDANQGAPVVDHDGNVLGGNGRAMSIQLAYEKSQARADAYRKALKERAARLGIASDRVVSMQKPVLVRRLKNRLGQAERQDLVTAMNESFTDSRDRRTEGKSRGDRFSNRTLQGLANAMAETESDSLRAFFDTERSRQIVESMFDDNVLMDTDRNALLGPDGLLNPDGKTVVEQALRGRAVSSYDALSALPADVIARIDGIIPHVLVAEGAGKGWNINKIVDEAIKMIAEFREMASDNSKYNTWLNRVDMMSGEAPSQRYSENADILARLLLLSKKKADVVGAFRRYANAAKMNASDRGTLGVSMTPEQARKKYFGMKPEKTGQETSGRKSENSKAKPAKVESPAAQPETPQAEGQLTENETGVSGEQNINHNKAAEAPLASLARAEQGEDPLLQFVYHGSPHRFDRFTLDNIGGGEGAQVHGWGLYFAADQDIADIRYRERLTGERQTVSIGGNSYTHTDYGDYVSVTDANGKNVSPEIHMLVSELASNNGDVAKTRNRLEFLLSREKGDRGQGSELGKAIAILRDNADSVDVRDDGEQAGQLYKVDIPENDVLLDEQKTFEEQPDKVKQVLNDLINKGEKEIEDLRKEIKGLREAEAKAKAEFDNAVIAQTDATKAVREYEGDDHQKRNALIEKRQRLVDKADIAQNKWFKAQEARIAKSNDLERLESIGTITRNSTGQKIYQWLTVTHKSPKKASLWLNEHGVKGITYEGRTDGRCFVIFDEQAVDIVETYYNSLGDRFGNPGEHLPPAPASRQKLKRDAVERTVSGLMNRANGNLDASVNVVQSFSELPQELQDYYGENNGELEGAYDPKTKTVWLVADNLASMDRAVQVWTHETLVHAGLRSMFSVEERNRILNGLFGQLGGLNNKDIQRIREKYAKNEKGKDGKVTKIYPGKNLVMEELVAEMAEGKKLGELTGEQKSMWRKIVDAIVRALKNVVARVRGTNAGLDYKTVDALLADLGRHVFDGRPVVKPIYEEKTKGTGFASLLGEREDARQNPELTADDFIDRIAALIEDSDDSYFGVRYIEGAENANAELQPSRTWVDGEPVMAHEWGNTEDAEWYAENGYTQIEDIEEARTMAEEKGYTNNFNGDTEGKSLFVRENEFLYEDGMSVAGDVMSVYSDRGNIRQLLENVISFYSDKKTDGTILLLSTDNAQEGNDNGELIFDVDDTNELARINVTFENRVPYVKSDNIALASLGDFETRPLASLANIKGTIRDVARRITQATVKGAANLANAPEVADYTREDDIGLLKSIAALPHWIAKESPSFAKIYNRQLRRMDERSMSLASSLQQVPSLFGKERERLGKADMDSLRNILWQSEGTEPQALKKVEKFGDDGTLANGRKKIRVRDEFYTEFDKWVDTLPGTDKARAALKEIRRSLDSDLVLAHNRLAGMAGMNDDIIKTFRQQIGHIPNYFPHHRYGKWYVQARDAAGNVVFRQHFDAIGKERAKVMSRLLAREQVASFPDAKWSFGENEKLPDEVYGSPVDTQAMEQIIMAATSKIQDSKRAGEVRDLLLESTADVLKMRGWGSHAIGRKGVPGFETEDITRVLYDYKAGLNGWLTKMDAAQDFSSALADIDARRTPRLWKYARQYTRDMLANADSIDKITGNIKGLAFAWYLGLNIKTAFVNATQNIVVGVPRLQMDVNGGALEWMKGAMDAIRYSVTGEKSTAVTGDEKAMLFELRGKGVITDAYMQEVRGHINGFKGANLWNRLTDFLGKPMAVVETFNRSSLALAAYRAARNGRLNSRARQKYGITGKATYEQAKDFADTVVRDAHFVYGKANTPEFLRASTAGRIMSPVFTFRSFTANMLNMWLWAMKTQGADGAKLVGKSIGATAVLGGVTALPFYATLQALGQAISGDDDDWTERLRRNLPKSNLLRDVVCYGVPAMAGVGIGGSLQMETPFTNAMRKGSTVKEVMTESMGALLGIPYSMGVEMPSRVIEAGKAGNTLRAVEEALPVVLKNGVQAWRLYSEGQTTLKGREINVPGREGARRLGAGEAAGKALGFQPVSSTKAYAAYAADKWRQDKRAEKMQELASPILAQMDGKDPQGRKKAMDMTRAWNDEKKAEGRTDMMIPYEEVVSLARRKRPGNNKRKLTKKQIQSRQRQEQKGQYQADVWGL